MKYIKGFDALRGISIILVLLTHLGLYHHLPENHFLKHRIWQLISGSSGVQIFFTLSGFLITKILLKELNEFKNIHFKYLKDQPEWNLEKINLTIKKGQFIGIQGISGSGKSTLIDLLVGLNKPDKGQFYIDGNSRLLSNSNWRKQIGYVSQNIILVDDTIIQNIGLGKKISEIDKQKINLVVEKSGLKSFIASLKNGLDTIVGERGVQLSGGQRQRIGIARALYQNPKILLLDEATSALDEKTENKIMSSIEKLKEDITIIIVAHRLLTLKQCDSIYEINNHKLKKVS